MSARSFLPAQSCCLLAVLSARDPRRRLRRERAARDRRAQAVRQGQPHDRSAAPRASINARSDCWEMPNAQACYDVGMNYEMGLAVEPNKDDRPRVLRQSLRARKTETSTAPPPSARPRKEVGATHSRLNALLAELLVERAPADPEDARCLGAVAARLLAARPPPRCFSACRRCASSGEATGALGPRVRHRLSARARARAPRRRGPE